MRVLLAPAWLQAPDSLEVWVQGLTGAGHEVRTSPRQGGSAARALDAFLPLAEWAQVLGGQSFGARLASLAAARGRARHQGVILISFPLQPDPAGRCAHFPEISCPVLVVAGTRDPLSPIPELRRQVQLLPRGRLVEVQGAAHDLRGYAPRVLPHLLDFLRKVAPGVNPASLQTEGNS